MPFPGMRHVANRSMGGDRRSECGGKGICIQFMRMRPLCIVLIVLLFPQLQPDTLTYRC